MPETARVKVTIVGYYTISTDEIESYGLEEFDPAEMVKVDRGEYEKYKDPCTVIEFFGERGPDSVTFELAED